MSMKIFILLLMSFYCFSAFSNICERTSIVKQVLLEAIGKQNCSEITNEDLKAITALNLSRDFFRTGIQLKTNDFSGLMSLKQLNLSYNDLDSLPVGIFSNLTSLNSLYLGSNNLSLLPPGIFSPLVSLEFLGLDKNSIPESEQIRIQEEIPHASVRLWEQRLH